MTVTPSAPVFVIAGPTASGKSALALALAERAGGCVINADSMQVYRGLEVLTDQPGPEARARVPHRLFGVLDAAEACSAGCWRDMALDEIADARAGGLVPVVAGGTGLYLRALMEGLAPVPRVPAAVRRRVRSRHTEVGNAAFHAELARRDPEGAAAVRPTDSQRMIRAAEVFEATGRSLAAWQRDAPDGPPPGIRFRSVLLLPPREALYAAVEDRFDRMLAAGALDEARRLAARGLDPALPAMKALGVPELIAAARGEIPLAEAVARAKTATRNYAKRQMTWFRRQMVANFTYKEKFSERLCKKIFTEIL